MKAAQLTAYGGKEAITVVDIPEPQVSEDQILVEVKAAGVNPVDWKIQHGYLKDFIPLTFPAPLGGDFAGIVTEFGQNSQFKKGDQVYGQASGSFAQYALANPNSVSFKLKKLTFIEAGALPLAGTSAIQALTEHINLRKGQKILIQGGAGGIGSMAVQIAKHIGASVATTVSTNDVEYVKKLGADEVINYKTQKFEDIVKDFDAVFDTVGGETTTRSMQVIKSGGILVSMVGPIDEKMAQEKKITALVQGSEVTAARLNKLSELVDSGAVIVHVEKTFPLQETAEALDYLKNTPPQGKVVVTP